MEKFQYAFLDSGVGGLPYLEFLRKLEPAASCVYIADIEHFPYGEKTAAEVTEFAVKVTEKIIRRFSPEIIVVACNTITVTALEELRRRFSVPFVGTVPAIKPAVLKSRNKKIGIIATERTVNDIYIKRMIEEFGSGCEFFMRADSRLVHEIETKLLTACKDKKKKAVAPALEFFKAAGTDTLVLGCTHFLHLRDIFIESAAPEIGIEDSLEGVIHRVLEVCPPAVQSCGGKAFYVTKIKNTDEEILYKTYACKFGLQFSLL